MNAEAEKIIARLGLSPLPHEGGFFRQTWLSKERRADGRPTGSAILFLLTPDHFSALHRLETDEIWHFCAGDSVEHLLLDPRDGSARMTRLGPDPLVYTIQLTVPGGTWQGARLGETDEPGTSSAAPVLHGWTLLACTMAPAWKEQEFQLGRRKELTRAFPAQAAVIEALTR